MAIQTQNPATGEVLKTFEAHTDAQVDLALAKSVVAFHEIRKWSFEKRSEHMRIGEGGGSEIGRRRGLLC